MHAAISSGLRLAIVRRAAFDDVAHIDLVALKSPSPRSFDRGAGPALPTKGRPCASSSAPGPLTDEAHARAARSAGEHRLLAMLGEPAASARARNLCQDLEARSEASAVPRDWPGTSDTTGACAIAAGAARGGAAIGAVGAVGNARAASRGARSKPVAPVSTCHSRCARRARVKKRSSSSAASSVILPSSVGRPCCLSLLGLSDHEQPESVRHRARPYNRCRPR